MLNNAPVHYLLEFEVVKEASKEVKSSTDLKVDRLVDQVRIDTPVLPPVCIAHSWIVAYLIEYRGNTN